MNFVGVCVGEGGGVYCLCKAALGDTDACFVE